MLDTAPNVSFDSLKDPAINHRSVWEAERPKAVMQQKGIVYDKIGTAAKNQSAVPKKVSKSFEMHPMVTESCVYNYNYIMCVFSSWQDSLF